MTFTSISNWDTTDWTQEMEDSARDVFLPLILKAGAKKVQMLRTGERSFSVVTEYADEAAADSAAAKIAEVREKAAHDLPMSMANMVRGTVFVQG